MPASVSRPNRPDIGAKETTLPPELWETDSPDAIVPPDQEDQLAEDDPDAEADPLSSLDEETKKIVEQYAASQAEAAAKTAAEEAEKRFRKSNGRWGQAAKVLADQFGFVVDEHGTPALADPAKLAQHLSQLGQAPAAQEDPAQAETGVPDPTYDPDGFIAWNKKNMDAAISAAIAEIKQENERLRGFVSQTAVPTLGASAKAVLDEYGAGEWADAPEFKAEFQNAIRQIPMDQWSSAEAVETAVAFALPRAKRAAREAGTVPQKASNGNGNAAGALTGAARGALPSVGASRGAARGEQDTYTPDVVEAARLANMSPADYVAVMTPPDQSGRRPYHAMLERKNKR